MTDPNRQQMTVTRVFDAPRELVWKTWTEPEHFAHWFGTPPLTTPVEEISMDVRPGGKWAATMVHEEDPTNRLPFRGRYAEVVEPERLVMIFEDVTNNDNPNVETLTVTFTDLGDGRTEIVANQAGHMPEEEYGEPLQSGYGGFFDRLEAHLADLQKGAA